MGRLRAGGLSTGTGADVEYVERSARELTRLASGGECVLVDQ